LIELRAFAAGRPISSPLWAEDAHPRNGTGWDRGEPLGDHGHRTLCLDRRSDPM